MISRLGEVFNPLNLTPLTQGLATWPPSRMIPVVTLDELRARYGRSVVYFGIQRQRESCRRERQVKRFFERLQ